MSTQQYPWRCSCGALFVGCEGERHDCAMERDVAFHDNVLAVLARIASALEANEVSARSATKSSSEEPR